LLERETAARYPDPYIQSEIDLSHVVYMATVNDDTRVPAVLRDRMRVIRLPRPSPEHVPVIVRTLIADAAADRGLDTRWAAPLDGDELELVLRLWRGGSVRRLREVVERILARREQQAVRH
jgi:ATP-dependent Lon protease